MFENGLGLFVFSLLKSRILVKFICIFSEERCNVCVNIVIICVRCYDTIKNSLLSTAVFFIHYIGDEDKNN